MKTPSRGKRLLRRYPQLAVVPEEARAPLVRAALRHPVLLLSLIGVGLLVLPFYFDFAFRLLRMHEEGNLLLTLAKSGAAVLAPVVLVVPLLSRFAMPRLIAKEMRKRGYTPPGMPAPGKTDNSSGGHEQ